ncbi:MAG: OmpA family protein [Daejeonella sp.]|uniref:OmpA family protein n=1 Tax=Daejeonella sp. TaxID=2805397 RepID=UPI002732A377|nr:OmpA family protein [Daejeonella sp.]MDP3467943.1 OmpA family protein [Daejeonella sp.]
MRNFKSTFSIFAIAIFTAMVLFSSCKPKKIISQAPAAPVPATVQEAPKAAVVEADTDGDGIPDSKDNCPNKPGSAVNGGCPETIVSEPTFNYKNILFEFNSSVLKTSSYSVLDEIAREMKKFPSMSFNLNGHSSAEGSEQRNMTLSIDRATAVKSYLVTAGINANNLITRGFGESTPLASNDTESGRQLNRRVEIRKR